MQVQINTDRNIEGHEGLTVHVRGVVEDVLGYLGEQITRVEVHIADENGKTKEQKNGVDDKRCMMEARLQNHPPLAVTAHAASVHQAVDAAADKLLRSVESKLGRLYDSKLRRAEAVIPQVEEE